MPPKTKKSKIVKIQEKPSYKYKSTTSVVDMKNKQKQITLSVSKNNKSMINLQDITDLYTSSVENIGHKKFIIRAMSDAGMYTLKSYNGELNITSFEDYMRNKVDVDHANWVENFYSYHITYFK